MIIQLISPRLYPLLDDCAAAGMARPDLIGIVDRLLYTLNLQYPYQRTSIITHPYTYIPRIGA